MTLDNSIRIYLKFPRKNKKLLIRLYEQLLIDDINHHLLQELITLLNQ